MPVVTRLRHKLQEERKTYDVPSNFVPSMTLSIASSDPTLTHAFDSRIAASTTPAQQMEIINMHAKAIDWLLVRHNESEAVSIHKDAAEARRLLDQNLRDSPMAVITNMQILLILVFRMEFDCYTAKKCSQI
eukprot:GHVR01130160.1.p1 GENE.GHVR01130160.1~~GHVR01130160.1.p1  ORF type:complete len:132 (+),score=9.76 GHVR01130160.1:323-718(+)